MSNLELIRLYWSCAIIGNSAVGIRFSVDKVADYLSAIGCDHHTLSVLDTPRKVAIIVKAISFFRNSSSFELIFNIVTRVDRSSGLNERPTIALPVVIDHFAVEYYNTGGRSDSAVAAHISILPTRAIELLALAVGVGICAVGIVVAELALVHNS